MRSYFGRSARAQSLSTDGGTTWTASVDAPTLSPAAAPVLVHKTPLKLNEALAAAEKAGAK